MFAWQTQEGIQVIRRLPKQSQLIGRGVFGENSKKLRESFGIRPQVTPDNYWDQVIATIQDAAWWLADRPASDAIAQAVWDGRSAFLDVLFYAPEKPVADLK